MQLVHAGYAEDPVQISAAGCDNPAEQQPAGGLWQGETSNSCNVS